MSGPVDVLALPVAEAAYMEAAAESLRAFQQGEIGFQDWKRRQAEHCDALFEVRLAVDANDGQASGRTVECQGPVAPSHESAQAMAHDGSAVGVSGQPSHPGLTDAALARAQGGAA